MSDASGPTGDSTSTDPGTAVGRPPYQPPRWAWWVVGAVVPLIGVLATVLAQTQRAGSAGAPPVQGAPSAASSTTSAAPAAPPASATSPSPASPSPSPPVSAPSPTRAPTRAPATTQPARQSKAPAPPARQDDGGAVAPPVGSLVRIVNGHSGLCLAVPGASTEVVDLNQFGCGPYADHFWRLQAAGTDGAGRTRYRIVNGNSGYCAAVPGASKDAAVHVNQFPCGDYPDHFWRVEYQKRDSGGRPLHRIVNANSGLCLAVPGAAAHETAPVDQGPCGPYADRLWRFGQE
ncbi:Ricin-type beta-trefoil lectin domain-like [Streptomyces sp. TLI_105]|nr:Ricin-type beta-trefoil lectin domain-like [Streptomyces sp. TLI_105]